LRALFPGSNLLQLPMEVKINCHKIHLEPFDILLGDLLNLTHIEIRRLDDGHGWSAG
jgi:hypothetical protein